jgi:dTDP-4-amino-4,6-dideoxygalactose transaminase
MEIIKYANKVIERRLVKPMDTVNAARSDLPEIERYIEYLKEIWSSRLMTNNGVFVQLLEEKLEEYLKIKNLIVVSNGTLALDLALRTLKTKGEVITTPFTFAATTNMVLWEGLTPVFADIDCETFNIDPEDVERKITKRTVAILAVHVYGNPCNVENLQKIADKHNIKLIYDAAHAFGVEFKNQSVLKWGDISVLSFHATKVFHTIEGGAIVVKDEKLLDELKLLRNHGIKSEEEVVCFGTNAKMNEFQAAMGLCNLREIDQKIRQRKRIYEYYKEKMSSLKGIKFQQIIASRYNYAYMPVCFENGKIRDRIYSKLVINGIKPRKYFFPLTANFDYFRGENLVKKFGLKNANNISNSVLCLPIYSDLELQTVDKITNILVRELA